MDCPQCEGGTLVTYALDGREAHVCEQCGYVGIPADHHGERAAPESWNDALRRYHEDTPAIGTETAEVPVRRSPSDGRGSDGPETWDEALARFGRAEGSDDGDGRRAETPDDGESTDGPRERTPVDDPDPVDGALPEDDESPQDDGALDERAAPDGEAVETAAEVETTTPRAEPTGPPAHSPVDDPADAGDASNGRLAGSGSDSDPGRSDDAGDQPAVDVDAPGDRHPVSSDGDGDRPANGDGDGDRESGSGGDGDEE